MCGLTGVLPLVNRRFQDDSKGRDCIIDADEIARKVVEPGSEGLENLFKSFGPMF